MTLIAAIFLLLVIYQVKHFLADYILQGEYMLGKFKGGWDWVKPLLAHVGVHAGFTLVISTISLVLLEPAMTASVVFTNAIGIACLDAFIHFGMDRLKASPKLMGRWKPLTAADYIDAKATLQGYQGTTFPTSWFDKHGSVVQAARKKLAGNKLFWWALGFDQAVHHLTHYVCIAFILKAAGAL